MMHWLKRHAAFATAAGIPETQGKNSTSAMQERLPLLSPEQDVALMQEAGLENIERFYTGLTFKGWVGYRSE